MKHFRQPAPNQILILDAFQEQNWAIDHLEDPLPRGSADGEQDAKRRLKDTIKNLNRSLAPGTIRFRGNGTGQCIVWEYAT